MKNIKNVVIISDSAEINGGAAKIAIQSALCLAKENIKVYFYYYPSKSPRFIFITSNTSMIQKSISIHSSKFIVLFLYGKINAR